MVLWHGLAVHESFGLRGSIDRKFDFNLGVAEIDNWETAFTGFGSLGILIASCDDRQGAEQ